MIWDFFILSFFFWEFFSVRLHAPPNPDWKYLHRLSGGRLFAITLAQFRGTPLKPLEGIQPLNEGIQGLKFSWLQRDDIRFYLIIQALPLLRAYMSCLIKITKYKLGSSSTQTVEICNFSTFFWNFSRSFRHHGVWFLRAPGDYFIIIMGDNF